jgi:hypothetical protein
MSVQPILSFDCRRTLDLVTGVLFDAPATWRAWLPESGDWRKTAMRRRRGQLCPVPAV